jgi:carboxypeptidase PM20D1
MLRRSHFSRRTRLAQLRGFARIAIAMFLCAGLPLAAATSALAADEAAERLAGAVRLRTVSFEDPAAFDPQPFLDFHDYVAEHFPRTHAALEREIVADYSLLYTWRGSDSSLAPVLLTSHHDVVPVIPGTESDWTHPAFGGVIADGFIWGRGTLDDKLGVLGTLEAVESLVVAGFAPTRTVYLAFGHDEELGGPAGAAAITALLAERGVQLWFTLDEGMAIISDMAGIESPIAAIGVAEKGYMTIELTARAPGGHSSIPPREGAIGRLAKAVLRVEDTQLPAHLDGVAGSMLDSMAPYLPTVQRMALSQRWLLGGVLKLALSMAPETNALIRTTTAVTIVRGGAKANVLPTSATATVNFRVHPSDTVDDIFARVREIVDDPEIEMTLAPDARDASEVASSDNAAYEALGAAIREVYPGIPLVPALVFGGTDSKHYGEIADDSYRFTPMRVGRDTTKRIHGIDERIALADYAKLPPFYEALLRGAAGPPAP